MNDFSHILNHLGEENTEDYFGAVVPPLIQSSIFGFNTVDAFRKAMNSDFKSYIYTRGNNPTVEILRKKLAALEGTEDALVFASGSAAIAAAVMSVVKAGDHVICINKPYYWTGVLFNSYLAKYGVSVSMIDGTEIENFREAIQPNTKLIFLESPNSITLELQDLGAVAQLAKQNNITTIIDNSYCTPLGQNPSQFGIDLVVHSSSKYINGHSDVVSGVICSNKERIHKILSEEFMTLGAIVSPHDAWLMIRGLRTLELRVERSCENASILVKHFENHPKIEKILYPHSDRNPQYALAKKQMIKSGGLFTMLLKYKRKEDVEAFCNRLQRFIIAVSWGGYESLMLPICGLPENEDKSLPFNMVRFYTGIESVGSLIEDLEQALEDSHD